MALLPRLGWLLFCTIVLSFASLLQANTSVSLDNQGQYTVTDKALWHPLPEPAADYSYTTLSRLLEQSGPAANTLVGRRGPAMARLRVHTNARQNQHWYLIFNANFIDKGIAYWQPDNGQPVRLAEFSQLDDQATPHLLHYQALSLPLDAAASGTLLLYVNAKQYAYPFSLKLMDQPEFNRYQFGINSTSLIAISVMMTLALIALMLYVRTRYQVTLACAGYIGLHGVGWAAAAGLINDSFRLADLNTAYAGMLIFPLAVASASQFTRLLFSCNSKYRGISRYLNGLTCLCLLLGCLLPLLPFWQAFLLSHLTATLWILTTLTISLYMLPREGFSARYYFTGNLIYGAALVFYMLSHTGNLSSSLSPELVVLAALAIDCLCILLSLAEWLSHRKREYNRSYYFARVDPLTQVGNRYAFNERQCELKQYSLLVFLDLDGMKEVNDKRGHDQGDLMLKEVAELMQEDLGDQGEVFRTGGDEFIWLADSHRQAEIHGFAGEIATRVAGIEQQLKHRGWQEIGISFGFAISSETESFSQCMALADQRMYDNKRAKAQADKPPLTATTETTLLTDKRSPSALTAREIR